MSDYERNWLDPQWNQRGLDALRETLDVDADTKRRMITFLFAEGLWDSEKLTWPAALTRFNACLNPAKGDFWKVSEVWALMKRFRRTAFLRVQAEDLGFHLVPVPTEARRQALLERIAEAHERHAAAVETATAELVRLGLPDDALRVHPDMHAPGPKFSMPFDEIATADPSTQPGGF